MVRLKVSATSGLTKTITDFNSTMVRLKAIAFVVNGQNLDYFNSTMVRLKEQTGRGGHSAALFQFHNGTIKSPACLKCKSSSSISIPQWYD